MELRQYQKDCGKAIVNFIERDTGHGIVAACPAAGKSILIARTAEYLHKRGKRVLALADRAKLIKQNYSKFSNPDLVGIVSAGLNEADYGKPITIGGIQTLYNKAHFIGEVEWILIDECHGVGNDFTSTTRYHQLIRAYPNARILGYSGTPYSLAEGAISWGKIIYEISYSDLLALGYVTPLTNKVADEPDLSSIKHSGAEYNLEALGNYMRQSELIEKAAQKTAHYIRANNRKKTLGFCVDVEHGFALYQALRFYGFKVDMVHGGQSEEIRNITYDSFEHGDLDILLNVELITKGVDFPCIDCIAFYRPTESMALWEQAISRGIRLYEGKKECLLLDFTGNLRKFGTLGNPLFKYMGAEKKKIGQPFKICVSCESAISIGREVCPECGYIYLKEDIEKELRHSYEIDNQTDMSKSKSAERVYTISRVEYSEHTSAKGRKSFRVTYHSGRFQVSEYIPFGQRYKRAIEQQIKFMRGRGSAIPESIEAALAECHQWKKPKVIQVQPQQGNPKYWELKGVIKWEEKI